jgi:bis(5'-nucleosyl)-tetraphosphatase (symmetrical)
MIRARLRLARLATYAVGDVQGCFVTLDKLLARIRFDPVRDRLWLVGDLVNRGPRSLEVLRWVRRMGDRVTTVLGNHDLHLLGRALGTRRAKPRDTLEEILNADDRDELIEWLRRRAFVHREGQYLIVHAGLHPSWTPAEAAALSREAEAALRGKKAKPLLASLADDAPPWRPTLGSKSRLRVAIRVFTGMRTCHSDGRPCSDYSGPPRWAPRGCIPWFDVPGRQSAKVTIICGHWAALGLRMRQHLIALDTGCVWGRVLTAVRLEDRRIYQEPLAD